MTKDQTIQHQNDKKIARWLFVVASMIFAMILLGGTTRLTHSGLSMVNWKPIMGIIPPISDQDWQATFHQYQQSVEFKKVNHQMDVEEFKSIFYFEYFHRLLGRLIGLFFLIPFLYFWYKGMIRRSLTPQMIIIFLLGGLQGVLGWYMVKSGLVNDPHVSQYRLTAHLLAAILIYSYILWVAFGLIKNKPNLEESPIQGRMYHFSMGLTLLILLMITTGGFVAGTRAGWAYNTFPLMAGKFIPDGLYTLQPFWHNWFENITTIQFNHRMLAYVIIITASIFIHQLMKNNPSSIVKRALKFLSVILFIQVSLGIANILYAVPVVLGVSHQGGAVLLLTTMLFLSRQLKTDKI